ncbi:MAG: 4'-phosphopantetheinyl transferase superfamily protein [Pseudomonadales bacterium]|nr:4'-phosphopantetheinyl transferase superfamily protein [Pseudomonadales bacterium]
MNLPAQEQIHLWLIMANPAPEALARFGLLLNEQERARHERFLFEQDRQRFLLTRAGIRTLLSHYVPGIAPGEWTFGSNAHGKPWISNPEVAGRLFFSISHTAGLIAMAVSRLEEIGLDVENRQLPRRTVAVAERFFAAQEVKDLHQLPVAAQDSRFFDLWTLKEAYIKARGLGLAIPLQSFAFSFGGMPTISFIGSDADDAGHWRFWQFDHMQQFRLALAVGTRQQQLLDCLQVVSRTWQPDRQQAGDLVLGKP